jgi:GNAT superfamily N-acetyltransferase
MSVAIRRAIATDYPLVIDNWLKSYRKSHAAGLIAMDDWDAVMSDQLAKILARPGVSVLVAFKPGAAAGTEVYGWLAVERDFLVRKSRRRGGVWEKTLRPSGQPLVHYVYTLQMYRERGIATALFRAAGIDRGDSFLFTCKTGISTRLAAKCPRANWEPMIARYPKRQNPALGDGCE